VSRPYAAFKPDLRPLKATYREWIGLAVIALPCIVYAMDLTVLNLAVPSLSAELKPPAAELLWIVDIYGFLAAGSLLIMGTLGDRIGPSTPSTFLWASVFSSSSAWPLAADVTDEIVELRLFGRAGVETGQRRRTEPNFDMTRR
jgi:DHA2 family multidrug resistance protein-like MFS transporter